MALAVNDSTLAMKKGMKMEDGKIRKTNPANLPIRKIGSFFGRTFGCAKKIGGLLERNMRIFRFGTSACGGRAFVT